MVESKIERIEKDIEEIELMLERKRKEREHLLGERQNFEKDIDKSRIKYKDQILKLEKQMEKI